MFVIDPIYMLMTIGIMAMAGMASRNVQNTFSKYSQVPARRRMTGAQTARHILDKNGLQNIAVEPIQGELTDHYDPRKKVVRLSEPVYNQSSLSAMGVAAHEVGHAIQDQVGYTALRFRQNFAPLAQIGAQFGTMVLMAAILMVFAAGNGPLPTMIGIAGLILYSTGVIFHLVTLPVEFNASSRAMAKLDEYGLVTQDEYRGTRKVLNAAAWTYVAQAVGAILMLLYFALIILGNRR